LRSYLLGKQEKAYLELFVQPLDRTILGSINIAKIS
jgi:hypothetical protein